MRQQYQTKFSERMSFGIYGIGLNIFFVLIGSFLQQYYVINAAVPVAVVGGIFLVVKIWDGINDPLFGVIVDKSRLKRGKYLPWMRIATVALPFTAALLFFVPLNAPVWLKGTFLLLGYMIYDSASTMTEVPYFAITTAMSTDPTERSKIISISKLISTLPAVVVLFIPTMYTAIGWKPTVILFAVFAMLTMIPGCFLLRERYETRPETPPTVKTLLSYVIHNKYLLIFFASAVLYGLTNTVGVVGNFFAINNLGSDAMIMPLMIISTIPGLLSIFIINALLGKVEKSRLLLVALAIIALSSVALYFVGYQNMVLFYIFTVIRSFAAGAHTVLFFLFTPDFSEYGTYITGTHAEGAAFSIQSLASKLIGAISSAASLFILAGFGFVEGLDVVQSASALRGIWLLFSAFPAVGAVAQGLIILFFYKLRDRDVLTMTKVNQGLISADEGAGELIGSYPKK